MSTRTEITNAHEELIRLLGIRYADIRPDNYMLAPTFPHALPSLPSPSTKRTYKIRIVDFEHAIRTNHHPDNVLLTRVMRDSMRELMFCMPSTADTHQSYRPPTE